MTDIAPELLDTILTELREYIENDSNLAALYDKIAGGAATYADAGDFAVNLGEKLSEILGTNITSDILPNGKLYYNIAEKIIPETLKQDYEYISDYAQQVQSGINEASGVGLKAQRAEFNKDRVEGIVNKISSADKFDNVRWMLDDPIVNFSQSVVDDTVEKNADFWYDAGRKSYIVRLVRGSCCNWCARLAGKYEYPDDCPDGIFQRHENCRCEVLFDNGRSYQDVHSKKAVTDTRLDAKLKEQEEKLTERRNIAEKAASDVLNQSTRETIENGLSKDDMRHPNPPKRYENDFSDCEELTLSDEEVHFLHNLKELSNESGFEYAQILAESGAHEPYTSGEHSRVAFKPLTEKAVILHSHTEECCLSNADLKKLTDPNVESISCITPSGAIYTGRVGDGYRLSEAEYITKTENIWKDANNTVRLSYPEFNEWTLDEKIYMANKEEMFLTIRLFGWTLEGGIK